ncbi:dihydrolipoamide acetyltransferase family protein [Haladaptatus sp. ZSTT2]|uniref:dihydrolipoamide acetyltransferase family protein n=1 Tax=Haladaptatus sp. ZSTT2 TaxID=3120515 RepID=UPI00300F2CE0
MTAHEFRFPDVGEGVAEGELLNWYVNAGDGVEEDQVIAEVETDKAVVEIPAPVDGTVTELRFEEGSVIPVGAVFVVFEVADEDGKQIAVSDSTTEPEKSETNEPEPTARELATREHSAQEQKTTSKDGKRQRTLAQPTARRIAHEMGIDINDVPRVETRQGEAFVTKDAVRAFASRSEKVEGEQSSDERVPYRGVRRSIGRQMVRSAFTIPHVTTVEEVDVTELVELRASLRDAAAERGVNLTYLPFVIMAVGNALKQFPYLNATLDEEAEEIVLKKAYNIGIATEAEDGLLVPVLKDVDQKSLVQIAAGVEDVVERARTRKISREEMQGGTFTITNIGPYGSQHGTPIINYPEVAILAIAQITQKPRVVEGDIVPRHVVNLSLSIDHRVIDGAMASRFFNAVKHALESPERFLLE